MARRINNYTMIYGLDNAYPQPWFRVMLFEGHVTLHQADAFFQLHDGFCDRIPPTNADHFTGPVEIMCLNIPLHLYVKKQARTQKALFPFSQGFMHPYDWAIHDSKFLPRSGATSVCRTGSLVEGNLAYS